MSEKSGLLRYLAWMADCMESRRAFNCLACACAEAGFMTAYTPVAMASTRMAATVVSIRLNPPQCLHCQPCGAPGAVAPDGGHQDAGMGPCSGGTDGARAWLTEEERRRCFIGRGRQKAQSGYFQRYTVQRLCASTWRAPVYPGARQGSGWLGAPGCASYDDCSGRCLEGRTCQPAVADGRLRGSASDGRSTR